MDFRSLGRRRCRGDASPSPVPTDAGWICRNTVPSHGAPTCTAGFSYGDEGPASLAGLGRGSGSHSVMWTIFVSILGGVLINEVSEVSPWLGQRFAPVGCDFAVRPLRKGSRSSRGVECADHCAAGKVPQAG